MKRFKKQLKPRKNNMNIKELIKELQKHPEDTQVFLEAGGETAGITGISSIERYKSNGDGTFNALLIY